MKDLKKKKKIEESKKEEKVVSKWKGEAGWPPMVRFVMNGGRLI